MPEVAPEDDQPRGTRRTRQNSAEEPRIQGPRIQELSLEDDQPRGTRRRRQDSADEKPQAKETANAKAAGARSAKARKLGSPIDFMEQSRTVRNKQSTGKSRQGAKTAKVPPLESKERNLAAPLDFLTPCPWPLPTTNNAISNFDPNIIARDALETTVIMHPRLPMLVDAFLQYKRGHGSNLEKA